MGKYNNGDREIILELLKSLNKGNSNSWDLRVYIAIKQFEDLKKAFE